MKVTKLRKADGSKLNQAQSQVLATKLQRKLAAQGFITDVEAVTHTQLKIGLHMKCFVIDTDKLGHNMRHSRHKKTLVGWYRTNLPTWDERVEFNDTINAFLDQHKVRANITSGPFKVRDYNNGALNECDWHDQVPSYMIHNACITGYNYDNEIEKLDLETELEAKEIRKAHQREQSRLRREQAKHDEVSKRRSNFQLVVNQ